MLQVLYKYVNRKFRKALDQYRDHDIVESIKQKYIETATAWFNPAIEPF
jgi:hypothetical protein